MNKLPDVMDWLERGVPLTLGIDLLDITGPNSRRILVEEPADTSWIRSDLTVAA